MPKTVFQSAWPLLAVAAGLFLAWQAAETLLLIFAGILLGVLLDALTRGMCAIVPLPRPWGLALVCLLLALAFAGVLAWSGYAVAREWDQLTAVLSQQLEALRYQINNLGESLGLTRSAEEPSLAQLLLPDPGRLLGGARSAFSTALGMIGGAIVIVMIGIFAAANPTAYRNGIVKLVPTHRRARVAGVLDEIGETLRWWIVGQLITMAIVGVSLSIMLALLGLPGAMLLALQAALINFIPYLGPFLAAGPILLAAAAQGASMLLWVLAAYVVIQTIEGYVLTPLIQKQAVHVPPVLTLASLMVFGALFGAAGIAMATPLVAVMRVAVLRLYVEDRLDAERLSERQAA